MFKPFSGKYSEEKLIDDIIKTLHFHNIRKQFLTIIVNNIKNNNLFCQEL